MDRRNWPRLFDFRLFLTLMLIAATNDVSAAKRCVRDVDRKLSSLFESDVRAAARKSSSDMIHEFKGVDASKVRHDYAGGEGRIYVHKDNPNLALKVFTSPTGNVSESIENFVAISKAVNEGAIARAANGKLVAPKILSRGENWITRTFYPNTVPLNEVRKMKDQKMLRVCERLMESVASAVSTVSNRDGKLVVERIRKRSVNIHCDPSNNRLVLIDSLSN